MNEILYRPSEATRAVAAALAKITGAQPYPVPAETPDADFARALAGPGVVLGVLDRADGPWEIVRRVAVPLVVVPPGTSGDYTLDRVLVPLDGTDEAAYAVSETVRLFAEAGIAVTVLHVFDENTAPAHWDQAAHARPAWEHEFRARFCHHLPETALTLRSGLPGEHIVDVAAEQADLIVLGWSRRLVPGRARIAREAVDTAAVPVLLIPVR
ncbi:universal stress protein [Nocardia seriolae]|uniref:UspA domain-containing protein n=1 Tax=Nocardia seriolae TaxID=37332 RepID=A0ABC9YYQ5_9NOCA|nr:universal stress protein [Nocardia seriolae]APA98453.1 hypothetical protein NS506_04405 [Nocardia seriolae]OJF80336.1 hypothetical protein NS14008_15395 [Nocardia seriolae]QOW35715.1 universal stress protein [Nocardia seriolae]QUN16794.1 universal stress protein [Nocardia seriolae]WKY55419.1 universal stress protein [Nocardia seriolae]